MEVSVVIPNYNGSKYILKCLEHVYNQTFTNFEVIIVDNNSSDDSLDKVRQKYLNIRIIKLDDNYGFSFAVNKGIKLSKAPYVLLLNNDAFIENNFIQVLYDKIINDKNAFSCCGKMLKFFDGEIIEDTGDFYNLFGWAFQRGNGERRDKYQNDGEVFSCCAGAAMYRKNVFDKIGFFDEAFFAYLEDIDVGYRSKLYGYKNYYCCQAICYHVGSASTGGGYSEFKVRLSIRNNVFLFYKNMSNLQLLINSFPLIIGLFLRYWYFKKIGFGQVYREALKEGFEKYSEFNEVRLRNTPFVSLVKIQVELTRYTFQYVNYKVRSFLFKRIS